MATFPYVSRLEYGHTPLPVEAFRCLDAGAVRSETRLMPLRPLMILLVTIFLVGGTCGFLVALTTNAAGVTRYCLTDTDGNDKCVER
jgi:hypothetical protein